MPPVAAGEQLREKTIEIDRPGAGLSPARVVGNLDVTDPIPEIRYDGADIVTVDTQVIEIGE